MRDSARRAASARSWDGKTPGSGLPGPKLKVLAGMEWVDHTATAGTFHEAALKQACAPQGEAAAGLRSARRGCRRLTLRDATLPQSCAARCDVAAGLRCAMRRCRRLALREAARP